MPGLTSLDVSERDSDSPSSGVDTPSDGRHAPGASGSSDEPSPPTSGVDTPPRGRRAPGGSSESTDSYEQGWGESSDPHSPESSEDDAKDSGPEVTKSGLPRGSGRAAVEAVRANRETGPRKRSPYEDPVPLPPYAPMATAPGNRVFSARNQEYIRKLSEAREAEKEAVQELVKKQGRLRDRLRSSVLAARARDKAAAEEAAKAKAQLEAASAAAAAADAAAAGVGEGVAEECKEDEPAPPKAPRPHRPPGVADLEARYGGPGGGRKASSVPGTRKRATKEAPRSASARSPRRAGAEEEEEAGEGKKKSTTWEVELPPSRLAEEGDKERRESGAEASTAPAPAGGEKAGGRPAGASSGRAASGIGESGLRSVLEGGSKTSRARNARPPPPGGTRPLTSGGGSLPPAAPRDRSPAKRFSGRGPPEPLGRSMDEKILRSPYSMPVGVGGPQSPWRARSDAEYLSWRQRNKVPAGARVFCTTGSGVDDVREGLLRRGWWENKDGSSEFFDFKWALKANEVTSESIKGKLRTGQLVNHFANASQCITTKLGLVKSLKDLRWQSMDEHGFYPRSHVLSDPDERALFDVDFRWTAAESVLKRVLADGGLGPYSVPSVSTLLLALRVCNQRLQHLRHLCEEDFTMYVKPLPDLSETQWGTILRAPMFKSAADLAQMGKGRAEHKLKRLAEGTRAEIQRVLTDLAARSLQGGIDGYANVWILKPGGKSRGRGIRCLNSLDKITEYCSINEPYGCHEQWVAQKYIEHPLVIERRKFDIRQWVLVTSWAPLTVWFYDDCYLRFCAEDYDLDDVENGFAHLSNNSIAKYSDKFETQMVGDGNMWESDVFAHWLYKRTGRHLWGEKVQPRMKEIVTASLLAAQDTIEPRANSIELYGYDFVVDESLETWLLEVNCSPCLSHSTAVTEKLVAAMIEDLLKVVVDYPDEMQRRRAEAAQQTRAAAVAAAAAVVKGEGEPGAAAAGGEGGAGSAAGAAPSADKGPTVPPPILPDLNDVADLPGEYTGKWEMIHRGVPAQSKARPAFPSADLFVRGTGLDRVKAAAADKEKGGKKAAFKTDMYEPPMASMIRVLSTMQAASKRAVAASRKSGKKKKKRRGKAAPPVAHGITEENALSVSGLTPYATPRTPGSSRQPLQPQLQQSPYAAQMPRKGGGEAAGGGMGGRKEGVSYAGAAAMGQPVGPERREQEAAATSGAPKDTDGHAEAGDGVVAEAGAGAEGGSDDEEDGVEAEGDTEEAGAEEGSDEEEGEDIDDEGEEEEGNDDRR